MSSGRTDCLVNPYRLEVRAERVPGEARTLAVGLLGVGLLGVGVSVGLGVLGPGAAFADGTGSAVGSFDGGGAEGRSGSGSDEMLEVEPMAVGRSEVDLTGVAVPPFEPAGEPGAGEPWPEPVVAAPGPADVVERELWSDGSEGGGAERPPGSDVLVAAMVPEGSSGEPEVELTGAPQVEPPSAWEPEVELPPWESEFQLAEWDPYVEPEVSEPLVEMAPGPVTVAQDRRSDGSHGGGAEDVIDEVGPSTWSNLSPVPVGTSASGGAVEWLPVVAAVAPDRPAAAGVLSTPEVGAESGVSVFDPGAGDVELLGSAGGDGAVAWRYLVSPAVAPGRSGDVVRPRSVLDGAGVPGPADGGGVLVASSGGPVGTGFSDGPRAAEVEGEGEDGSRALLQAPPMSYLVAQEDDSATDDRWVNDLMHGGDPVGPGTTGHVVEQIQEALSTLGLDTGRRDSHFGPRTTRSVMEFQRSRGLPVDGVVGPETARKLIKQSETRKERMRKILERVPHHET